MRHESSLPKAAGDFTSSTTPARRASRSARPDRAVRRGRARTLQRRACGLAPEKTDRLRTDVALVAHGGYGRRDVAPYSDVDLMILHSRRCIAKRGALGQAIVARPVRRRARTGPKRAHAGRRLPFGIQRRHDFHVARRIAAGSPAANSCSSAFRNRFLRGANRRWRGMFGAIRKERGEERGQFGETVYLLEPNIKRSPGGLRDIQLLRWVGFARYGTGRARKPGLDERSGQGRPAGVRRAREFLLRLRNEMHFHAGKTTDVWNAPSRCASPRSLATRGPKACCRSSSSCASISRTRRRAPHRRPFHRGCQPWMRLAGVLCALGQHPRG